MNQNIENLTQAAIKLLSDNWQRCDKETGEECKGPLCDFPEHQVMLLLCDISNENKK